MAVTALTPRRYDIYGTDDRGKKCIFPRHRENTEFATMCDFRTKNIYVNPDKYCAFPFSQTMGGSVIIIFSEGDAHGDSDRQQMVRTDDGGLTFSDPVTFYENDTAVFNYSLLDGLMSEGDTVVFKIWTVTKEADGYSVINNAQVDYDGNTYSVWSKPKYLSDGNLYRTGYTTIGSDQQSALFKSTDGGETWAGVSVMFAVSGKKLNECDFAEITTNNLVAFCREDTGSDQPLYHGVSADLGLTWTGQVQIDTDQINGRQPILLEMADGSHILATGDRSGQSGVSSAGDTVNSEEVTGVSIFRSTGGFALSSGVVSASYRTEVAGFFSTDGGQPAIEEISSGRLFIAYYAARAIDAEPVIGSASLDVHFLTTAAADPVPAAWSTKSNFTPTLYGGTTAGTPVISLANGLAYKIGGMATVMLQLSWSDLGGAAGSMFIGNMPYTNNFDNQQGGVAPPALPASVLYTSTDAAIGAKMEPDSNYLSLTVLTTSPNHRNTDAATDSDLSAGGSITVLITYPTED